MWWPFIRKPKKEFLKDKERILKRLANSTEEAMSYNNFRKDNKVHTIFRETRIKDD